MRLKIDTAASPIAEFDSPDEAIAHSIAQNEKNAHRLTIRKSLPATIATAAFSFERATFTFGPHVLNIFASNAGVDFDFDPANSRSHSQADHEYELVWSPDLTSLYHPNEIVQRCVTKTLADISVTDSVNLYFQNGGGILQFRSLWCSTLGQNILYIYELEPTV